MQLTIHDKQLMTLPDALPLSLLDALLVSLLKQCLWYSLTPTVCDTAWRIAFNIACRCASDTTWALPVTLIHEQVDQGKANTKIRRSCSKRSHHWCVHPWEWPVLPVFSVSLHCVRLARTIHAPPSHFPTWAHFSTSLPTRCSNNSIVACSK